MKSFSTDSGHCAMTRSRKVSQCAKQVSDKSKCRAPHHRSPTAMMGFYAAYTQQMESRTAHHFPTSATLDDEVERSLSTNPEDKPPNHMESPTHAEGPDLNLIFRRLYRGKYGEGVPRTTYIALGTAIPNQPNTRTSSRRATAAVANNNALRSGSSSFRMLCRW